MDEEEGSAPGTSQERAKKAKQQGISIDSSRIQRTGEEKRVKEVRIGITVILSSRGCI